jgi:hypothetical protein
LRTIADLTGWSIDTFEGRLHFWIALQTLNFPETPVAEKRSFLDG